MHHMQALLLTGLCPHPCDPVRHEGPASRDAVFELSFSLVLAGFRDVEENDSGPQGFASAGLAFCEAGFWVPDLGVEFSI